MDLVTSNHPVGELRPYLDRRGVARLSDIGRWPAGFVKIAGRLTASRTCQDARTGELAHVLTLEDETGSCGVRLRPRQYARCSGLLAMGDPCLVSGTVKRPARG